MRSPLLLLVQPLQLTDNNIILAPHVQQAPQAVLSKESVKDLSKVFSESLANVMSSYGIPRNDFNDGWDEYVKYYSDEEEAADGIEPGQEFIDNADINNDDELVGLFNEPPDDNNNNISAKVDHKSVPGQAPISPNPPVVEPDKSLPLPLTTRAPTNWHPDPSSISWADKMVDTCEWADADRAILEKQFSPEETHDHLFTAVPPPKGLVKCMQASETKKWDWRFSRVAAEGFLYEANKDIVCAYRPLLEVISNLKGDDH